MSASYWVEYPGGTTDSTNVTYNLGPMLRAAGLPDWDKLDDAPCSETHGVLVDALEKLLQNKEELIATYHPPNNWGSWKWAFNFVAELAVMCMNHPDGFFRSSR